MSQADELRASLKQELNEYEQFLSRAKDIVDLVPFVEERKQEAEAKLVVLNNLPEDILDENAPRLLEVQKEDENQRKQYLPILPAIAHKTLSVLSSGISSASTATFYEAVIHVAYTGGSPSPWVVPISEAFESLAASKTRKTTLPGLVGRIRPDLSSMFTLANDSVDKAKNAVIGTDQAAMRMRDVIEQLWGAIVEHTKQKCSDTIRNQNLEIKREAHRLIVANCLATPDSSKTFSTLLDDLYALHKDLSPESKNMLTQDRAKLEELHTRWILQIDALVKLLRDQE